MGVKLGMTLGEIVRLLGPERLSYELDDDSVDVRAAYNWTKNRKFIEVAFGKDGRSRSIYVDSKSKLAVIGGLHLLRDSYEQVARQFGVPTIDSEPTFAENNYVYYDYGYSCGGEIAFEVVFVTALHCRNPNMGQCLDREPLRKRPIHKVGVRLTRPGQR